MQAYFLELKQDKETCKLSVISSAPTNFSDWGGLWTPCAGSVSPWNTHLGSEEYEPNGESCCCPHSFTLAFLTRSLKVLKPVYLAVLVHIAKC